MLKRIPNLVFDIIEIYLPSVTFLVLFICYVIMIAYRYIFYSQLGAVYELSIFTFIWSAILAASYGGRSGGHVMFTIIYDKLSDKVKLIFRLIGDVFIITTFSILLPYAYNSVCFLRIKKSSIMKIPFNIFYFPFIIFVALTIIHYLVLLIKDIILITKWKKGNSES